MKVCFVNPATLLRRPIAEIIKNLSKDKSNDIGLLIPKRLFKPIDNSLHYSKLPGNVRIYTYSTIRLTTFEQPIPVTPMFIINTFRVFLRYDIIHMWAHFYILNLFVNLVKLLFPKKKLIMSIDSFPGYSFSTGRLIDTAFKVYTRLLGWFVFGVPNIITLYGKSLIKYAEASGINKKKIKVIPTGINLDKFKDYKGDIDKEFKIPKNAVVILFVGLLNQRKGVDIFIKTLKGIKENFIAFIVGDGPKRKEYETMAKDLKNKIIFAGFRKDVGRFYKSADILFFPSRGEGLAGAIMEAMLCKIPVITTRIPCSTDLVGKENGFLCKVDDVDCFKQKLEVLIKDKELRKRLGERGYRKIQNYSWDKRLKDFVRLYE